MNPLARALRTVGDASPFALAHHPRCSYYDHHTFELYGVDVCMGCFVVYPVGFASLATLSLVRVLLPSLFGATTTTMYVLAALCALPLLAVKATVDRPRIRTRIATKALFAVGAAWLFFPAVFRPADRLVTAGLIAAAWVTYVGYKGATALDDCEGCPQADEFPNCSGMELDRER